MRRQDRLLSESDCRMVLARVEHAVLATVDPSGAAYGVPVTPVEADGVFYFHGAAVGRKADNLAANPSASLTWIAMGTVLPAEYSVDFVSVIASGKVVRVEDPGEKKKALRAICARFAPHPLEAVDAYIEGSGGEAGEVGKAAAGTPPQGGRARCGGCRRRQYRQDRRGIRLQRPGG